MPYRLYLIHADLDTVAVALVRGLRAELEGLGYAPDMVHVLPDCKASVPKDTIACGVFIGSLAGKIDPDCVASIQRMQAESVPVIPLVEAGQVFHDIVPNALHPINALSYKLPFFSDAIVPLLLRLLGLTERQRRVFISYRRSDALKMGEQVWEVLSKSGFEVFVDRFYVEPGIRFQDRLTEALADKAFVLLIESPDVGSSTWVEYEVNYALEHRLGFCALTWPATVTASKKLSCLVDGFRVFLSPTDVRMSGRQGEFEDVFLERLPALVEGLHAQAMLRRRRQLMSSLESELSRLGIEYKLISDWSLLAQTSGLGMRGDQVVSLTPRPPDVPDLFALDGHCKGCSPPIERGVLIHSVTPVRKEMDRLLGWVIENRALTLASEDQIVQLVESLAAGGSTK